MSMTNVFYVAGGVTAVFGGRSGDGGAAYRFRVAVDDPLCPGRSAYVDLCARDEAGGHQWDDIVRGRRCAFVGDVGSEHVSSIAFEDKEQALSMDYDDLRGADQLFLLSARLALPYRHIRMVPRLELNGAADVPSTKDTYPSTTNAFYVEGRVVHTSIDVVEGNACRYEYHVRGADVGSGRMRGNLVISAFGSAGDRWGSIAVGDRYAFAGVFSGYDGRGRRRRQYLRPVAGVAIPDRYV